MDQRDNPLRHWRRIAAWRCAALLGLMVFSGGALRAADGISPVSQVAWLAGCWRAPNAEAGTGEHWTPPADGAMFGVGRTMRSGKLLEWEFMQIRANAQGGIDYIAQPFGKPPTVLQSIRLSGDEAVFENAGHDFPQRVIYRRTSDESLVARIEGTSEGRSQAIDYPMQRVDCNGYFLATLKQRGR